MPFNDPFFLFVFLPLVLGAYFVVPAKYRNAVALSGSVLFYAWGEPRFVLLVVATGFIDWFLGRRVESKQVGPRTAITISVVVNLGLLIYFKYADFFISSINEAFNSLGFESLDLLKIALPFGISFVVFQKISYVVDVSRGTTSASGKFTDYLLYILLFPQLIAGPIVKYHDISDQLKKRAHGWSELRAGIYRFSWGLAKKVILADGVAQIADESFGLALPGDVGELGTVLAWAGLLAYTLQIYLDFSAYSDMAIGLARIMGFRLLENFDRPYMSHSLTEFWRRWHISLSTFIRDYLYFPLGGSRMGEGRTYLNLWICFLASGLWHGAAWTFVIWGAWHGLFLCLDRLFLIRWLKTLPGIVAQVVTFLIVMFGWLLFRSESLAQVMSYLKSLFIWTPGGRWDVLPEAPFLLWLSVIGVLLSLTPFSHQWRAWARSVPRRHEFALVGVALLMIACFSRIANVDFSPFLYFRF